MSDAADARPGASAVLPGVTYVMPVLNEVDYLEAAVRSVFAQHYDGPVELVLAVGPSTDGTAEVVERLVAEEARLRVVDNPDTDIPIGLNRAIAVARYPVIVRVDAHTTLAPDYTSRGVATLERTGAASLGGIMVATGRPGFQLAVARAYNSRFGLGGGAYHGRHAKEGPAESAYMGIMRKEALDALGGFDESLRRGEDWELNYRLRHAGRLVWLDPHLVVSYWPRSTWPKLVRQFFATGVWRGELVRRLGARNPLRFFAPPALLVVLVLGLLLVPVLVLGVLPGWLAWLLSAVYLGPLLYLGLLGVAALRSSGGLADRLRFMLAVATMHMSWGAGFLVGAVRGARDVVDTSRTES
ncbi:MAG: glycosyltransferase family 2 protein [Actinomycetales bacterium]|nr:glycosyltransferase family 2 protein [Actinomycetales bacterium]